MVEPEVVAAAYIYVDTALGALNRRNRVKRLRDIDFGDFSPERYITHRRATSALLEWWRTHTNANGQPTIEGYDGAVWDPSLPFDFDDRTNPAHALEWLRQFLERLERYDVPLDSLRIYFSGAKGFHLEIPHTLFGGFEPSDQLHTYERAAALELMAGIPFDTAVYDKLRLWRLVNTLNAKGQRYKIRLSLGELRTLSMDEILALAESPRSKLPTAPDEDWAANEYLVEVWQRATGRAPVITAPEPEPTAAWSDVRHSQVSLAAVVGAIAYSWPSEPGVSRHSDYLLPLSGYLVRLLGAEHAAQLLKEAAERAGDRSFLDDRQRHWQDEIDRLAAGSAAKIANRQPVEGLPTIARRWPELAEVLSTNFVSAPGKAGASKNGQEAHGFAVTVMDDLLSEPAESVAYLTEGMLPSGGVSLWGAKPKVGKSVAVRNLALCVARGEPFLGRACHQGAVVVLALEEKRAEVANHFRNMGASGESIYVHVGAAPGTSKEGMAALASVLTVFQPVLVVVDPVLKLVRVRDSSDYAELTRELEPVIELARHTGCHIAVTHHLGKMTREGGDDVLGSTAIFGAVDTLVLFRRRKDNQRVLQTIQRYGPDLDETVIPMDSTGRIELGSAVSELKQVEARAKVREVLEKLGDNESLDLAALREQAEMGRNEAHRAVQELIEAGVVDRFGEGRRGNPWRYFMASPVSEKTVLLYSPTSSEIQQYRNTGTGSEIEEPEKAATGELFPGQAPVEAPVSEKTVLLYSPTSSEIQQYRNTGPEESLCRACGKPLSEAEARVSLQLHWDCTLP